MEQNAASYNPGRMDQYLWPYYNSDIQAGNITPEEYNIIKQTMAKYK